MAGTNAVAAAAALITLIDASASSVMTDVAVSYSFDGTLAGSNRDLVYGGEFTGPVTLATFRGSSGRLTRDETVTWLLHISVYRPGQRNRQVTDTRAAAIGAVIEEIIASDPLLGNLANLLLAKVVGMALDGDGNDDGVESTLTYQISFRSYLD